MILRTRDGNMRVGFDKMNIYDVSCDFCSTGEGTYEAESFRDLLDVIKEEGWETIHGNKNKCPDCADK